jgi:hypothetical protein
LPTLKLDSIIGNCRAEDNEDGITIIRAGTVEDLPHSGNGQFDPTVLTAALNVAGVPQMGNAHPQYPAARVIRRLALPTESVDTVKIEIHYGSTSDIATLPDNRFRIIRRTTTMTQELTEFDWDAYPNEVFYFARDATGTQQLHEYVKMPRLVPLEAIIVSGVLTDVPSVTMRQSQGCVNDGAWQDYAKGYWLCAGLDIFYPAFSTGDQRYVATATFLSKVNLDWAGYGKYTYEHTGKVPTDILQSDIDFLRNQPYGGSPISTRNGLVKSSLYQMANLAGIFPIDT